MILQIATALAIGVYVVLSKDVQPKRSDATVRESLRHSTPDMTLCRHHRQLQNHNGSPSGRNCQKAFRNSLDNMGTAHVPSPLAELLRTVARLHRWHMQNKRSL
jgi:hypothetical protein